MELNWEWEVYANVNLCQTTSTTQLQQSIGLGCFVDLFLFLSPFTKFICQGQFIPARANNQAWTLFLCDIVTDRYLTISHCNRKQNQPKLMDVYLIFLCSLPRSPSLDTLDDSYYYWSRYFCSSAKREEEWATMCCGIAVLDGVRPRRRVKERFAV